jgi:hypothetical protein
MPETSQSFAKHARLDPLFHFFVLPVFGVSWIISIVWLVRHPSFFAGWGVVLATATVVALFKIRLYALKVQDRVIRLEERLRLTALCPENMRGEVGKLSEAQLIGLRFASDAEVPGLVQRALAENLSKADIKKSIKNWRGDFWRV